MKELGRLLLPVCFLCLFGCGDNHEDKDYIESLTKDSAVSDIDIVDNALERCIIKNSEENNWETLEDITYLECGGTKTCAYNEEGELSYGSCSISSLEALKSMPNLEFLSLGDNFRSYEKDNEPLKVIAQISSLTKLSMYYDGSKELVIETGDNLKTLEIFEGAENLIFTKHPSVEILELNYDYDNYFGSGDKDQTDVDPGGDTDGNQMYSIYRLNSIFPNLKKLTIDASQRDGFRIVSDLGKLQSLTIKNGFNQDFSQLEKLTNLHTLISENSWISSVEGIEKLESLVILNLYGNQIVNASPISALKNLRHLDLGSNKIEIINGFSELDNVTRLYLGYNNLSDIYELGGMKQLNFLRLIGNEEIDDFSPLLEITKLKSLICYGNYYDEIDEELIAELDGEGC